MRVWVIQSLWILLSLSLLFAGCNDIWAILDPIGWFDSCCWFFLFTFVHIVWWVAYEINLRLCKKNTFNLIVNRVGTTTKKDYHIRYWWIECLSICLMRFETFFKSLWFHAHYLISNEILKISHQWWWCLIHIDNAIQSLTAVLYAESVLQDSATICKIVSTLESLCFFLLFKTVNG